MAGIATGGILNIALDPVFIFCLWAWHLRRGNCYGTEPVR